MTPANFFYMLFDGPPKALIPHFALELAQRDANVRSLKNPLARLSMPYRLRTLPSKDTRAAIRASRGGLITLPATAVRYLTHNADICFRLHGIDKEFTLVEGLRYPDDLNQSFLPVTPICVQADLRLFTFYAGSNRLLFSIKGPGSELRLREAWREDGQSTWVRKDNGKRHNIEVTGTALTPQCMLEMLARLSPQLPTALLERRFTKSFEFKPGISGARVSDISQNDPFNAEELC